MEVPMSTVRTFAALFLVLALASSHAFAGQQHIVPPNQLAAALEQQLKADDGDRSAVREALARPEVREAAAKIGVDLSHATAAVESLQGPDLARAADVARQLNEQLVGGASSITITTTTIIIALLIAILLIVAIK
jgi:hypothetical protein